MPGKLVRSGLIAFLALLPAPGALAEDLAAGLLACRSHSDTAARLACYDALPAKAAGTEFKGAGSFISPAFEVATPTLLRFESMDAIMVIYLLDETGAVVQNLHQAGAGTGSWKIDKPGRYRLQVNASGGWLMQLEVL